jgi:thymidylate kinase
MVKSKAILRETARYRAALAKLRLPSFSKRKGAGPVVVALEGANGAGKTTLCQALSRSLRVSTYLGTDAAWFSDAFKTRMIRDADWPASAMFFLSGCLEQMRVLETEAAELVIMDRCIWSTLAVHGAESTKRLAALLAMLKPVASLVRVPDLTLVLEATYATCQTRIAKKAGPARALDALTATPEFHAREREFYHWLARQRREIVFLDVDQTGPKEVAARAQALIRERVPC